MVKDGLKKGDQTQWRSGCSKGNKMPVREDQPQAERKGPLASSWRDFPFLISTLHGVTCPLPHPWNLEFGSVRAHTRT